MKQYEMFGEFLTEDATITVYDTASTKQYEVNGTKVTRPAKCFLSVNIVRNGMNIVLAYRCNGNAVKLISAGAY